VSDSERRPALLLVDEGQVAFGLNLTLWGIVKACMSGSVIHLRIISHGGKRVPTLVTFKLDATVGLWPTEDNEVSLQLTLDEANELWDNWCKWCELGDKLATWDKLRDYVFTLTAQQPGLLIHVLDFLKQQGLKKSQEKEKKAEELLQSHRFIDSLLQIRSLVGIGESLKGQEPDAESMRSLVRKLLSPEDVYLVSLKNGVQEAAKLAVKCRQVIEDDGRLSLPSALHRQYLFREVYCTKDSTSNSIERGGLEVFIHRVIERIDPHQLSSSLSWNAIGSVVYESQFQHEFYRAASTILPRTSILSPNVGPYLRVKGYLDYILYPISASLGL
jgi:hypothetical protein